MAARSVQVQVENNTGLTLSLVSASLSHGIFNTQPPPPTIGTTGSFEAESNGVGTGVQGSVVYQIGSGQGQTVALNFDNPFVGSDQFDAVCTPPNAFNCATVSNGGTNANITYALSAG